MKTTAWRALLALLLGLMMSATLPLPATAERVRALHGETEPNDNYAQANNVTNWVYAEGLRTTVNGTIGGGIGNDDYFSVWLNSSTTLADKLTINLSANNVVRFIEIRDPGRFPLKRLSGVQNGEMTIQALTTGVHYILVTPMPPIAYFINITVAPNQPITRDNDNSKAAAAPVTGTDFFNTGTLDDVTDIHDFYKFTLTVTGDTHDVVMVFLTVPAGADYDLWLVDAAYDPGETDPNPPAASQNQGNGLTESIFFPAAVTKEYYIRVITAGGNGTYTLKVLIRQATKDSDGTVAPNATAATELVPQAPNPHQIKIAGSVAQAYSGTQIDAGDTYKLKVYTYQRINATLTSSNFRYVPWSPWPDLQLGMYNSTTTPPCPCTAPVDPFGWPNDNRADPFAWVNSTVPDDENNTWWYPTVFASGGAGDYNMTVYVDTPPRRVKDIGPGNQIVIMENQQYNDSLDLKTIFTDRDGDALTFSYSTENGTASKLAVEITNGVVKITPQTDWVDDERITLVATETGVQGPPVAQALSNPPEDDLVITVHRQFLNHPPAQIKPFADTEIKEGQTLPYNLRDYISESDAGQYITYTASGNETPVSGSGKLGVYFERSQGAMTGVVSIAMGSGDSKPTNGAKFTLTFTATDDGEPPLTLTASTLNITVNTTPADRITLIKNLDTLNISGDTEVTRLDLSLYFKDSQNHPVNYSVSGMNFLNANVSGSVLSVSTREVVTTNMTEDLTITVRDTVGTAAQLTPHLTVFILGIMPPPKVISFTPSTLTPSMNESASLTFSIAVKDADTPQSSLKVTWSVSGKVNSSASGPGRFTFSFATNYSSAQIDSGRYTISVQVSDSTPGNAPAYQNWTVFVNNVNRPPVATMKSPAEGAKFLTTDKIKFEANATDPDEDDTASLQYRWYDNDQIWKTGKVLSEKLKAGTHRIKLEVKDPAGLAVNKTVTISVAEPASKGVIPGFEAGALAAAMAGLIAAAAWRRRLP